MKYFVHPRKPSKKAHIWTGVDTYCRMYSTGGISASSNFKVFDTPMGRPVCALCESKRRSLEH